MGVTGTGKTTVGRALAQSTGWAFADADDFHSEANREKMRAGIPLTDEDRVPWLESLHAQIVKWNAEGTNAILACSALRESYRATLIDGIPRESVRFFYLNGPAIRHSRTAGGPPRPLHAAVSVAQSVGDFGAAARRDRNFDQPDGSSNGAADYQRAGAESLC